jgi:proteasome lid subunit RPN8/RPN11
MGEPRLRLLPREPQRVRTSRIPRACALRWRSPYEQEAEPSAVSVFVTQRSFVRVCAQAGSDLDNEVGGVLAGKWRVDADSGETFVVVEGVLPAPHTRHGSNFVTFTQDSLVALNDALEERYPRKQMVGWYHTHPRMGVFLSSYDAWLHENFFPEMWQVALVIDPHAQDAGFFIRSQAGVLDTRRYYGFHELLGDKKRSIVHWENMHTEDDPEPVTGG